MRRSHRLRLLIFAVFAMLLPLLLCEAALRVAYVAMPPTTSPEITMKIQRSSPQSAWYLHSPYWSLEFVESFSQSIKYGYLDDHGHWVVNDLRLPGYTIHNNERMTTDQPSNPTRDVWMFGNSATFGSYVADGWTISSYLQRELNAHGAAWRVRNFGQTGVDVAGEYYWLTQADIRAGDIVIFIDGAMDIQIVMDKARVVQRENAIGCQVADRLPLLLARLWCERETGSLSDAEVQAQFQPSYRRYWEYLDKAKAYTQARGAQWYHFVQPTTLPYADLYAAFGRGDAYLRAAREDYFDVTHLDDDGHATIARQIVTRLVF